jgi:hypothetical protein
MAQTIVQPAATSVALGCGARVAELPPELRWLADLWPARAAATNRLAVVAIVLVAASYAAALLGATGAAGVLLPALMVAYSGWIAKTATAEDGVANERLESSNEALRSKILDSVADLVGAARSEQAAVSTGVAAATRTALEIALLEGWGTPTGSSQISA